jgi:5-hydroxyisourate hydrolase-like protein (transthyretin family)
MPQLRFFRALRVVIGAITIVSALLFAPDGVAQAPESTTPVLLEGRVERGDQPVPGSRVTLHRVTSESSGEVASVESDADGRFRFPLETVPGTAFTVYFATAEYLSVRYFGRPIHSGEVPASYTVEVYDTASALTEPIRITRRDMVLLPELNGSWDVNEIIRIHNPTNAALVAGPGMPTWSLNVIEGASDFEAGESDILPHEVNWMGDRVLLLTPVTPGSRDLLIRYRLPAGPREGALPISAPTDTFNIYVQQPSHLSGITGMSTTRMIDIEGESFLQYGGVDFTPGSSVRLSWGRGSAPPVDPVIAAVVVTVGLLLVGAWVAIRNRSVWT